MFYVVIQQLRSLLEYFQQFRPLKYFSTILRYNDFVSFLKVKISVAYAKYNTRTV